MIQMKKMMRFGLLMGISILWVACSSGNKKDQGPPRAVPVTAGTVIQKTAPVEIRVIGNVQAYSTITVKSIVGGEISQVHFTEGQDVKKGDLLLTIDPRSLEAILRQSEANLARDVAQMGQVEADLAKNMALVKQAEATLERDRAQAENARVEAKRYELLIERQVVSRQQYDQFRTNAEALEATVRADQAAKESAEAAVRSSKAGLENVRAAIRADQAAVENARIQLGYCFIRSPMDGRTGNLLAKRGTVVKANDIDLLTINQVNPIYVAFSVPEQRLPEIKRYMEKGPLRVEALSPNDAGRAEQGTLTFIDNAVDRTTGTILLKGTFANKERRLWPGQFVNVALTLSTQPDAIIVPTQAVQTGQTGQYVFVIKPDLTVELRPVVVNRVFNSESIIEKGLQAGEKVVTDGQSQLVPGARVEVKEDLTNNSRKGS